MSVQRMLSSTEVSEILGIPIRTLDNWAHQRVGPKFFKVGRSRRYREGDVESWLAGREVQTEARTA